MNKTHKKNIIFSTEHYNSGDGMLTSVWGPGLWHYLHTMSFNYPVKPSEKDKTHYREFILNLENVLPCGTCRTNLKKNFKSLPLKKSHMKNRYTFSKYVYDLHELINNMLGKNSGLTYEDVRERYEHFRSRCVLPISKKNITRRKTKETGCIEPLYGQKSKCIIKIVPNDNNDETLQIDDLCLKKRELN